LDSLTSKYYEYSKTLKELPLTDLQNEYTDLQTKASQTEDLLNSADVKHQKTSESLYKSLISNGNEQIDNLKQ